MLRDAEFFRSRISKLEGASDLGDSIFRVVDRKLVSESPAAKPNAMTPAPENTTEKPQADGK